MRLHRLSFSGIGPFAGEHHIDFAAWAASGLFLLEGPTGAGKSTIIDAIVFALYGGVADASLGVVGGNRMRSDHAGPDAESWVELVFEADGVFKVRRTPKYERPKQRGSGTITQQSSVKLWRKTSPDAQRWELISAKVEEAAVEVVRVIGLSRDQFTQTVVLPQGQFASFLKADTERRRPILQKVFGTWLYEELTKELDSRRKAALEDTRAYGQELVSSAHALAAVAGLADSERVTDLASAVATGQPPAELAELTAQLCDTTGSQAEALGKAAAESGQRARSVQSQVRELARASELAESKRRLTSRLHLWQAAEPARERRREELAAAKRAARAVPALDEADRAAAMLDQAVRAALQVGVDADSPADQEAFRQALVQAEATLALARQRGQGVAEFEAARQADELAAHAVGEVEQALDEARELSAAAAAALAEFEARAPGCELALAQAEETVRLVAAYAQAVAEQQRCEQELTAALAGLAVATSVEHELRERRISQMGAELAADLAAGQPCPVCGSTEHPALARASADQVSPKQLANAEAATRRATALVDTTRAEREEASKAVAELAGKGGSASPAAAQQVLEQARSALAALGSGSKLGAAASQANAEAERWRTALSTLVPKADAAHDQRVGLEARAGGLSVAQAEDAVREAERVAAVAARRLAAVEAMTAAEKTLATGRASALAALRQPGFSTAEDAREASVPDAEMGVIEQELVAAAAELQAVESQLAQPEVAAASDDPVDAQARLAEAEAAAERAESEFSAAQQAATVARMRAEDCRDKSTAVLEACVRLDEVRRKCQPLIYVAELAANGKSNLRDVDLPTFVLIRRFEEVIAAANDRLGPMSSGRFALERSEGKEGTRHRRGLSLRVMDSVTGEARDPRTLSGGESFYVSLALALGLADIVTAEAGGVDLGTLFIDEGFGALDDEVRDRVLQVLSGLRKGGRVVGIVSHVDSLKQSIAERVSVSRLPDGSSTLQVRA
ncbi:MAG: AAA family ATPase [Propionibacteriaceae bacterium]|jgi:exonuclease SbcC|nr:AAA family ATPase [Propionibacteriaceae bacterium]